MGTLKGLNSGAIFGHQSWAGGWSKGRAEVPHATTLRIGAGERVYKESACDASDSMQSCVLW